MKKSLYSLTLFDNLVEQIDSLAFSRGTNRSQLVNDILASYLGLQTPEQKIRTVLESVGENMAGELNVSPSNQNNSIYFGKSLKYKYRPKIVYMYEFKNEQDGQYAVLKISSRTQNQNLNALFNDFFQRISIIETKHQQVDRDCGNERTQHKFVRAFKHAGSIDRDEKHLSDYLTRYLKMIDSAMDDYFGDYEEDDINDRLDSIYQYFLDNR
jgi:hypothetical protein